MSTIAFEVLIIFLLAIGNGVLALSEIAIVSARKAWLQQRAEEGDGGARIALELSNVPDRFLSTVQIGITLVGILAGAFGGATLADVLGTQLDKIPLLAPYSDAVAIGLVVLGITYISLVIGELVPKRLALNNAEKIATVVAPPMQKLSIISSPIVSLLSFSTERILRALGAQESAEPPITEKEVKILIEEGTDAGIFEKTEQEMVEQVFRLGDLRASALMTPRKDIVWLDTDATPEEIACQISDSVHSSFPVAQGALDNVLGIVQAKDLLACGMADQPLDLRRSLRPPLFVPEGTPAFQILERFRENRLHIALVIDEHSGLQGLVTTSDILKAIAGEIPLQGKPLQHQAVQRQDGSWLLDGLLPIDKLKQVLEIREALPGETQRHYETLGGFVLKSLGRIPTPSDQFDWQHWRFEIMDMDGHRVDKVLVLPVPKDGPERTDDELYP